MAYVVEYMTKEIEEKVLRDFAADSDSLALLKKIGTVKYWGEHTELIIDREKDFYLFRTCDFDIAYTGYSGHWTYIFFFKRKMYCVRVYSGARDTDRVINGLKVERGFSCFEKQTSFLPVDEMREFACEFSDAYLIYLPLERYKIRPLFSNPFIFCTN